MKSRFKDLEKVFMTEVYDRGEEIDPAYQIDWIALTMGWALGKGLDPDSAKSFASYIQYETNMG